MKNKEAKDYLISLIERDTPKSPIKNTNHIFALHRCSVCVCILDIPHLKEVNFCPKCGQRIDWSKSND